MAQPAENQWKFPSAKMGGTDSLLLHIIVSSVGEPGLAQLAMQVCE
jgi:hypothetical protein